MSEQMADLIRATKNIAPGLTITNNIPIPSMAIGKQLMVRYYFVVKLQQLPEMEE